jgi:DNA-binding transcriptional MerR regulator
MAEAWETKLANLNKKTPGFMPGESPVPVKNILKAFRDSGMSEEKIAEILSGFMATVDVKPADAEAPTPAPATLTLDQIVKMMQDPSKHADIVAQFKKLTPEQQAELKAQVLKLKPVETAPAPDVDTQKLVQPVLNAMQAVQTIATSSTPKRTKMLDVIDALNKVLPTPALNLKDEKGETYAAKLTAVLNSHADKFGTTATPGDKFVKLINASIQQNKPIELPQAALESELHNLRRAAGIV